MKKYNLELNEKQVNVIMWALDLYSRLNCGQLGELRDLNETHPTDETLVKLQKELFPKLEGLNHSYGIAGRESPERAKIAYDIYKQIHFIFNPVGVYSYKPYSVSKEGLPEFSEK